jgi:hypothetical protein
MSTAGSHRVGQATFGLPWRDLVPAVPPDAELHLAGNDERPRLTGAVLKRPYLRRPNLAINAA